MRNLRFLSLLTVIFWISCAPVNKSELSSVRSEEKIIQWKSPFLEGFDKAVYHAKMEVKGKRLSGIVLFKKTSDTTFHFSFANEIGMTYFDIEFSEKEYQPAYVFSPVNKKAFLKILHHDFRMIFFTGSFLGQSKHYKDPATLDDVYYYHSASFMAYFRKESPRLSRIVGWTNPVDAVLVYFGYKTGDIPTDIKILNPRIGMIFDLDLIGR